MNVLFGFLLIVGMTLTAISTDLLESGRLSRRGTVIVTLIGGPLIWIVMLGGFIGEILFLASYEWLFVDRPPKRLP